MCLKQNWSFRPEGAAERFSVFTEGIQKTEVGGQRTDEVNHLLSVLCRLSSDTLFGYENNQVS